MWLWLWSCSIVFNLSSWSCSKGWTCGHMLIFWSLAMMAWWSTLLFVLKLCCPLVLFIVFVLYLDLAINDQTSLWCYWIACIENKCCSAHDDKLQLDNSRLRFHSVEHSTSLGLECHSLASLSLSWPIFWTDIWCTQLF